MTLFSALSPILAETNPDVVYIASHEENKYLYCSDTEHLLGVNYKMIYQPGGIDFSRELIHPMDHSLVIESYFNSLSRIKTFRSEKDLPGFTLEYRIKHNNGNYLWIQSRHIILRLDDNGDPLLILGMLKNISSKKQIEHDVVNAPYLYSNPHFIDVLHQLDEDLSSKKKLFSSLTKREVEVIQFIKEGLSTKMIAEKLNVSFHTVESHRKNIHQKLNINSSLELIRFLERIG